MAEREPRTPRTVGERTAFVASLFIVAATAFGANHIDYVAATDLRIAGREPGSAAWQDCEGAYGIRGLSIDPGSRAVRAVEPSCERVALAQDGLRQHLVCGSQERLVGVHGGVSWMLDRIGIVCADDRDRRYLSPELGGFAGQRFELLCPPGQQVTAVRAGRPLSVKSIQMECRPSDDSTVR